MKKLSETTKNLLRNNATINCFKQLSTERTPLRAQRMKSGVAEERKLSNSKNITSRKVKIRRKKNFLSIT